MAKEKLYRFRIIRGAYVGNDAGGNEVIHEPKTKTAVIETTINLAKKYGRDKFQRLDEGDEEVVTKPSVGETAIFSMEELDAMTVEDLRALAAEEEIDLGALKRKEEIINKIAEAMSNRE